MAQGYSEAVNSRIIPYPDPTGTDARMVDMTIGGVEYTFDWETEAPITVVSGIYTFSIGQWGFVEISYDDTDVASNPIDTVTITPLVITQFRVANPDGSVISPQRGPVNFDVTGETSVTDTVAPVVTTVIPTGTNIATDAAFVITVDEEVVVGTGNYYLKDGTTTLETIATASTTIGSKQITVQPLSSYPNSTVIHIEWDAGVVEDMAGNPIAANSTSTYSFTTVAASSGNPATVDLTVSSASAARFQIQAWAGSWPSAASSLTLGIDANTTGTLDLSNITVPTGKRIYVRHVGNFLSDYRCSTFHQGIVNLSGSTGIFLYLMDLRSPNSGAFNQFGVNIIDNTTDCGIERCSLSGWPFDPTQIGTGPGANSAAYKPRNSTRLVIKHNVYRYYNDGHLTFFGTHNNLVLEGNMGLYSGGDDYTVGGGAILNDITMESNFLDRHHYAASGVHNDGWQQNSNGGGSQNNRYTKRYNVGYRGNWGGNSSGTGNGWQLWFMSGAGNTSVGPWLNEHELYINGQQRGVDRIPGAGGGRTTRYCAAITSDTPLNQTPGAPWTSIRGQDTVDRNFVSVPNLSFTSQEGTGGVKVVLGGASGSLSGADFTQLLPYMTNAPTELTDLWDIRPVVGSVYHPDYTPSGNRVGPFDLWAKLFAGDAKVVLSKVGWPVAQLFIDDFDRGDNFWGGYSGVWDADGNNV